MRVGIVRQAGRIGRYEQRTSQVKTRDNARQGKDKDSAVSRLEHACAGTMDGVRTMR